MAVPAFLGKGLIRPFRRDQKNDFANGAGVDVIRATAGQILGTRCDGPTSDGEMAWRPEFGSRLFLLRHKPINATTRELARHYSQEALRRWEPRIVVTKAQVDRRAVDASDAQKRGLLVLVFFDLIDRNVSGNRVLLSDVDVAVAI